MRITNLSQLPDQRVRLDGWAEPLFQWSWKIGAAFLAGSLLLTVLFGGGIERFFFSYLIGYCFYLSLTLGAMFFTALQHLTRSGWSVVIRRLAEITGANIPVLAILFLPILIGMGYLYPWTSSEALANDTLLQWKRPYLNIPFFILRALAYFGIWWWLSQYLLNKSVQQDESGDVRLSIAMERTSALGIILLALTITFASFDWLMTLDPHWFSTIYGVYFFSGCLVGFFALISALCWSLQRAKILSRAITADHYHDLGKLLFAFVFFWGYIAFSQYMLIWYGNIPEETEWIFRRQQGTWAFVGLILLFGHLIIPFLGLLSRYVKRRKSILIGWAIWLLVMHWVDLFWLVMPERSPGTVPLPILDIACTIGVGGLYLAGLVHVAKDLPLIPLKDPRLAESLTFENA